MSRVKRPSLLRSRGKQELDSDSPFHLFSIFYRKAQANTRAVSERQQLETLSRDLRSKKESAKGFEDKLNELESKKNQLQEEETTLKAKKEEADKVKEKIGQGLKDVKEELRKAQEERNRIK